MKKLISKILVIMALAVMAMPLTSNAGFQANKGGTSYKTGGTIYANHLFEGIRNMEKAGGTLGLNAQLGETTYLDTTNNGLDCHMAKNTEWGTAAMLATSIYGEVPADASKSISGNDSGIFEMINGYELVAGIGTESTSYMTTIKSADKRYYDLYESSVSKPGDATTETANWKSSSGTTFPSSSYPMFVRNYSGLFGFGNHDGGGSGHYASARAVVVCGAGL